MLDRLPAGCHLLDVGIGTGSALLANRGVLLDKAVQVTGVDIDPAYVARCRTAVAEAGLSDRIEVRLESIYDHRGGPYGGAYPAVPPPAAYYATTPAPAPRATWSSRT